MAVSGLEIFRFSEGWRWWQFDFSGSNCISVDGDSFLQRSLLLMGETNFPDLAWLGGGGPGSDGDGAAGFPGGVGLCPACAHCCACDGHGAKAEGLLASSAMTRQIPVLPQAKESSLDDGSPEVLHHLADDESSAGPCVVIVSVAFPILLVMIEGLTTTVQDFTASPSRFSINNPILSESFQTFVDGCMHCPRSCNFNLQAASSLIILVVSARQKISYNLSNAPLLKVYCSSNLPSCLFPNRRNHAGFAIRVELEPPMQPWLTGLLLTLLRFNDKLRGNPLLSPVMLTPKSTTQQQTSLCRFHRDSRWGLMACQVECTSNEAQGSSRCGSAISPCRSAPLSTIWFYQDGCFYNSVNPMACCYLFLSLNM